MSATLDKRGQYHHGDLRAGLVEAARRLVEDKGPDRFTMSDACRMAGVSTAAPYRHFADKDELLLAVAHEGMLRQSERMAASVAGLPVGSVAAIAALGRAYVDFARDEPGVFRLMFALSRRLGGGQTLTETGKRTFGQLLQQVAAATGMAMDDPTLPQRAFPLWTFVHGLSFLLIDEKAEALGIPVDIDALVTEAAGRFAR